MKLIDPRMPPYRATPGGVVDATRAIQAAIDDVGIGAVYIGAPFKVRTLRPRPGTRLVGDGWDPDNARRGSVLHGTEGANIIELPSRKGQPYSEVALEGVGLVGGLNQIVSSRQFTFLYLEHVLFFNPREAAVAITAGSAEEWYFREVVASGGKYFLRMQAVPNQDAGNYLDKSRFVNVVASNQTENAWRIETTLSNDVTWDQCVVNFSGKHAFYADGGIRSWLFRGGNTEQCGVAGKNDRTTGAIASGSTRLSLASPSGFAVGDVVTVAGAGAPLRSGGRRDFSATVKAISGSALTLDRPTPSAASKTAVTNAVYDDFLFTSANGNGSPGYITWLGGQWGMEGSRGRLRYSMNFERMASFATLVGCQVAPDIPVYDPNDIVTIVGAPVPRRPA